MQARTTEEAIGRRWMVGLKLVAYVSPARMNAR